MKCLLACFLSIFSFMTFANADELSINASTGETSFEVVLAANPTTGYQWSLVQYDQSLLTLSTSYYKKPDTNLIGAGGQMVFGFTLKKGQTYPASSSMVFKYARSWDPGSATIKNVTVHFLPPSY